MKLLKGLNTDTAHVDQPGSTYRRARNMILDDLAGALSVEAGSAPLSYFDNNFGGQQGRYRDYSVMGSFKIPGDRIVMALKKRQHDPTDTEAEAIVEVTQLSAQFGGGNTLTNRLTGPAGTFGWDLDHPIQGVGYVNAAGQTILVWTDGDSAPQWLNLDNWSGTPNLVFPDAKFPMTRPISFSAQQQNGEILGGSWSFMIAYEVVDGTNNITQYGPAIGSFRIGNVSTDENATYKTNIGLKFYGLDTNYNYARIYGVRNYNGTETVHYCDRIRITTENQEWEYLGQVEDETNIPALDELYIPRASYTTAETLAVSDDRLFMANLRSNSVSKAEGEAVANQITMRWTVDQTGRHASQYDSARIGVLSSGRVQNYTNDYWVDSIPKRTNENNNYNFRQEQTKLSGLHKHDNFGLLGGFMPDSVYALYIAFLMKDGTWSEAFHIPGGGNNGVHPATNSGFATQNTTTVNMAGDGFTLNFVCGGELGYVGNANETYPTGYTNGVLGGNLQGAQVRHHRMPTTDQMFRATKASLGGADSLNGGTQSGTYSDEWANMHLSLFADNVVIPEDLANKIQGWNIFYAKAGVNDRRVKGYVPAWAWHRYANLNSSDPLYGTKNITVNALRIYDPYINQTKPNNLTDWNIKEVYKRMCYPSSVTNPGSFKDSGISEFAFLPNNVNADGYDNSLREAVLAISLDNSPTDANGWTASFPGYFAGNTSAAWANSTFQPSACHGWQGCTAYDSVAYYDNRNSGENGHGGNFASSFGSAHRPGNYSSSTQWYANVAVPDKSSAFYGNTFIDGVGWRIADTGATGSSAGLGFAGIGNMMAMCEVYEDMNQYFENYAAQELVACNDLVHVDGADTYYSSHAVNGGDTFISPVVVEFMAHRVGVDPDIEPINEQYSEATEDRNNLELGKISYFTYTYLPSELGDFRETENLEYFGDFGSDFGVGSAVNNFFQGQFLNDQVWGAHYYSVNDAKSAFPFNEEGLNVTQFPNRIIRSGKQAYETTQFAWNAFAPADYYDNDLAKEEIRNLEDYKGELIIHHQNAIYKTRSKFTFDASGTDVFVGTGDIFQAPPMELFPDNAGYAGITHWGDSLLCRAGYTWVDREGKKVYLLSQGLEELSANGMRDYFRDDFCNIAGTAARFSDCTDGGGGYAIGYDPKFDRIFYTGVQWDADGDEVRKSGETLSYSLRNKCWASMHDRLPLRYFQSYSSLFFMDEYNMRTYNTADTTSNYTFMFEQGNANHGFCTGPAILTSGAMPSSNETFIDYAPGAIIPRTKSYVDVVFNMGGATPKVWQNFNWVTRSGDGEGDLQGNKFENMTVYNDYQISATVDSNSLRKIDNRWNFNNFRDIATGTGSFFTADGHTFDTSRQDNTKAWYNQGRIISEYAIIRLETLNQSGDSLYLTDVSATARKAQR